MGTRNPETMRAARMDRIREKAGYVRACQATLDAAIADRDAELRKAHGHRRDGKLSYEELRKVAGISKGRVIQVITRDRDGKR